MDLQHVVRPARRDLGRSLTAQGILTPGWAPAFAQVDRAAFLPQVMWPHNMSTGQNTVVDQRVSPDAWHAAADADVPITTQWDDGHHTGPEPGRVPTSSASMPSVTLAMLRDLDVRDGHRVLVLGTGTGYDTALLTHRLGADGVTSVETDPAVMAYARLRLHQAGYCPTLVESDGARGWPARAPYDRIMATYGVRRISREWIRQAKPGAVVLAPYGTHYSSLDALLKATVVEGGQLVGRFLRPVEFMKARSQRTEWPDHRRYVPPGWQESIARSHTTIGIDALREPWSPLTWTLGLAVPDCTHTIHRQKDGTTAMWVYGLTDLSWAVALYRGHQEGGEVYQGGPRRLWDAIEAAWRWWDSSGRPGIDRYGLTVPPTGAHVAWLDTPSTPVPRHAGLPG